MKVIAIHQPNYIPWLGYFYKISQSDCFVFLDDAQFSNEGMHNFNYIKTSNGRLRLKVPVKQTLGDAIMNVKTRDELGWKQKHLDLIQNNYQNSAFFPEVFSDFRSLLLDDYESLSFLNEALIKEFCRKLGIVSEFIRSSSLNVKTKREERIIDICSRLNGDTYLSGTGAMAYQKEENFESKGIRLKYSVYSTFEYTQLWEGFYPNVTILDYLFNCGYDWQNVLKHQNGKED